MQGVVCASVKGRRSGRRAPQDRNKGGSRDRLRSFSKQEEPMSMILMLDLLGERSRMFSGFRSQWMMCSRYMNLRAERIWMPNLPAARTSAERRVCVARGNEKRHNAERKRKWSVRAFGRVKAREGEKERGRERGRGRGRERKRQER